MSILDPTEGQLDYARRYLMDRPNPEEWALHYIGAILGRFTAGEFDSTSIRQAVAMYRVWDREIVIARREVA